MCYSFMIHRSHVQICDHKNIYFTDIVAREAVSPEEGSSVTVSDFKIKEEKYDELQKETEDTVVKTEPSDDSRNDDIICKLIESDDETVYCSQHDVMSLKSEPKRSFNKLTVSWKVFR
ncbi:uncharacterized protein LOC143230880 [Tachypleus tridentatus]|uniref:uncharacterized protein LOC143230880 n=1 Tax=Tachypleus tridentatus TaxID=6853 RepID=UPI003FD5DF43